MSRRNLLGLVLAGAIGTLGGWVFSILALPLPWMLGSMLFTAVAAIGGAPVALVLPIRNGFVTILGLMLGSSFTADLLTQLDQWASGMVLMIVSVTLMTIFSVQLFRRFGHFDHITAYFSSTPGGLGLMTLIGEQEGGEARTIAMVHSARIFFTVFAIPAYLLLIEGIEVPRGSALLNGQPTANPNELMILTGCAIVGYSVGRLIRLPGYQIIGPMAAAAAVYIAGFVTAPLPAPLIWMAQVVLGASIGVRFRGIVFSRMAWPLLFAFISGAMMLTAAIILANLAAPWIGVSKHALLLALAPGGLAEMCLIGYTLGVDPAFTATMHIIRILLVATLAPVAFRLLHRSRRTH